MQRANKLTATSEESPSPVMVTSTPPISEDADGVIAETLKTYSTSAICLLQNVLQVLRILV